MDQGIEKVRALIKDIDFCMLTTMNEEGMLVSRPMSVNGNVEFDGDLWFFTYGASHKVLEIKDRNQVNVSFSSPDDNTFVSVAGTAELVRDRKKLEELWQPQLKAWFPEGVDTPDIALIKVSAKTAEYWDSTSSFVAHSIGLLKSFVSGKPYEGSENRIVSMSRS